MNRPLSLIALTLLALPGCQSVEPPPPSEVGFWQGTTSGIERRELRVLATDFWEGWLRWHPARATALGDPANLGRWPSTNESIRGRWEEGVWEQRTKLSLLDRPALPTPDRINADQLDRALATETIWITHELDRWLLDPLEGPQMQFLRAAQEQPAQTARQRDQLLQRWTAFGRAIEELRLDSIAKARGGFVASRGSIERNVAQLDSLLAVSTLESPMLTPACGGGRWVPLTPGESIAALANRELDDARRQDELLQLNPHVLDPDVRGRGTFLLLPSPTDPLTPTERGEFVAAVATIIDEEIRPALDAWRETLAFDLLLRAPSHEQPGLVSLPGGTSIYNDLVWVETTLDLPPGHWSEIALDELEALESELPAIAGAALGTNDSARIQSLLRGDRNLFHPNAGAVEAALRADVARASREIPRWFNDLARQPLVITPAERPDRDLVEALAYLPPATDSSRPGRLLIDVQNDRQPIYATAAAAYGEGIPGRHFVRSLLRERPELPLFRRYAGPSVIEAGWVDYAEGLAEEMGLYADDLERLGRLTRAIERRALAVADVGLHLEGWSRDDARAFLDQRTFLSPAETSLHVDILLGRPGHALAPIAGATAIRQLREASENALGDDFDIRAFHDALVSDGPIDLTWLAERVGDWGDFDGRDALGI